MKQKIWALCLCAMLCFSLVGCGTNDTGSSETVEDSVNTEEGVGAVSFTDGTLVSPDFTIVISDCKVIQPGEEGNEYGEKPLLAFWYDTTNTGDSADISPMLAWIQFFEAIQDNDPNVVNVLGVGPMPDARFSESQMQDIKPGGTAASAFSYELDDLTTPVTLIAKDTFNGEYGKQEFRVAEIIEEQGSTAASSPTPAPTSAPTTSSAPAQDFTTYQSGMYKVGVDIPAGEYLFLATSNSLKGYLEVSSDSSGDISSIVTNENFAFNAYATVYDGQYLTANRCIFCPTTEAVLNPRDAYTDGTYKVGVDIPAGEYKIVCLGEHAYYESTEQNDSSRRKIIANGNLKAGESAYLTVFDGQYFRISGAQIFAS